MGNHLALIAGATGLVGSNLLKKICDDPYYDAVYVLTRRPIAQQQAKVHEIIVDFDNLQASEIPEVDDVFCCLGTTMKKAGSKENYRKIDYHYPFTIAELAYQKGAKQFFLISSMGANKRSIFFYTRLKGETEEAIVKIGYQATHIIRPAMLLGQRKEKRTAEGMAQGLMKKVAPLMVGNLKKYRAIEGGAVAQAMLNVAKKDLKGPFVFESDQTQTLAAME